MTYDKHKRFNTYYPGDIVSHAGQLWLCTHESYFWRPNTAAWKHYTPGAETKPYLHRYYANTLLPSDKVVRGKIMKPQTRTQTFRDYDMIGDPADIDDTSFLSAQKSNNLPATYKHDSWYDHPATPPHTNVESPSDHSSHSHSSHSTHSSSYDSGHSHSDSGGYSSGDSGSCGGGDGGGGGGGD